MVYKYMSENKNIQVILRENFAQGKLVFYTREKWIQDSFQIQRNMTVATVFLFIIKQIEFLLVHNQKETRHYDHIPFNLKETINSKEYDRSDSFSFDYEPNRIPVAS